MRPAVVLLDSGDDDFVAAAHYVASGSVGFRCCHSALAASGLERGFDDSH